MNATVASPNNHAAPQIKREPVVAKSNQFGHAFKSEFRKITSLRSTAIWAVLMTGCLYGIVVLQGLFTAEKAELNWSGLLNGSLIFVILAIVFGAGSTAGEMGNHMQAHAFLTQKSRWHWLASRFIITALFVVAMFALGVALAYVVTLILPKLGFHGGDFTQIWATAIFLAGYALIAASLAVITRSRVAGLALPLVWFLVIENLLYAVGGTIAIAKKFYEWSPGHAIMDLQMSGATNGAADFSVGHNLTVLAVWVIVTVGIALFLNQKRDIR